jgi:hypothetical protein
VFSSTILDILGVHEHITGRWESVGAEDHFRVHGELLSVGDDFLEDLQHHQKADREYRGYLEVQA